MTKTDKVGEYTIVAEHTLSGWLECSIFQGRSLEERTPGKRMRLDGIHPTFLAKSMEDAKRKVREKFGCETQSSLEDFK